MSGFRFVAAAILFVLILLSVLNDIIINYLLSLPGYLRYVMVVTFLALFSLLIGFPFPIGMKLMAQNDVERSLAWASNGIASVLSAIAAAAVAMMIGTTALLFASVCAYAFTFFIWILFSIRNKAS